MEIRVVDKNLVINDVNNHWILEHGDILSPPVKRVDYILFNFKCKGKGTFEIRIDPKVVSEPVFTDIDHLLTILTSWCNLLTRQRAYDDVTEQFKDYAEIISVYPVGVPDLMVGNNQTGTLWIWNITWTDTHIPNKLGGFYNKLPIPFINTNRPEITNYQQILAKVYGQKPTVSLWTMDLDDSGNPTLNERGDMAKTTLNSDLQIDTIFFELDNAYTGEIILS
jgi:hypothetical protein